MLVEILVCPKNASSAFVERKYGLLSDEYIRRNPYAGSRNEKERETQFTRKFLNPHYITNITECNNQAYLPVRDENGNYVKINGKDIIDYYCDGTFKTYVIRTTDGEFTVLEDDFNKTRDLLGVCVPNMTDAATHEREERDRIRAEEEASRNRTIAAMNGSCT